MSLFKFEVTVRTIRELLNSQTIQSLEELDEHNLDNDVNSEEMKNIQNLIKQFTGDKIPLRIETDDWAYGVALNREDMRLPPSRAFLEEPEYVLFGRVERRILSDNSWDPILATSIIDRYLPEDSAGEEMREGLEEAADDMNLSMESDDWELPGHTAIIHPIAMFW